MSTQLPAQYIWLEAAEAAAMIKRSRRHFLERVAPSPDFPRPSRPNGGRPLWRADEINRWLERYRERERGRAAA